MAAYSPIAVVRVSYDTCVSCMLHLCVMLCAALAPGLLTTFVLLMCCCCSW